jgi:ABC-type dipeptide/oligopeptide/nickel transport system permease subunit
VNVVHEIGCLARPAYRWRTALYFALAGPAAFALFFCANGIIAICFDGVRGDRPVSEFVTMLMVFPILSFLFAYVAVLPAFLGLGLWLLAAKCLAQEYICGDVGLCARHDLRQLQVVGIVDAA